MAEIIIDHGLHGPEPKFEGDCWTISYRCSKCNKHVSLTDSNCPHCKASLDNAEKLRKHLYEN